MILVGGARQAAPPTTATSQYGGEDPEKVTKKKAEKTLLFQGVKQPQMISNYIDT